ncbi:MAG: MarR family transcriptional regulator [Acidimicrobiales bacterium]
MPLNFDPIAEARTNWERNEWESVDAMAAATSITRAHQIILGRINEALEPFGLNFSRFEALALLSFSRSGSLPLGKMGERLQVHPTSVTNTIDRLERDGLVERVAHPTDGRTTLASLTSRGRELLDLAQQALAEIEFGLTGLADAELGMVEVSIAKLRQGAGDF